MVNQSSRALVVASVMAAMFMVAIEATIITTAMPQIVAAVGGLRLYSWVFSAFLLAQTALTVVFGNLSDIHGRKSVMLTGIAIFMTGSLLAGFVVSMPMMILCRVIQGIGAGAMQPVAMTIIADLYPARERGKVQGYLASVWAISAVLGPIAGGLITRHFSWAWVFWINLPIGLIAAAGFIAFLHEHRKFERRTVDIAGAIAFTIAVTSLLIGLAEAGSSNTTLAATIVIFCISATAFVIQEQRISDPMVSFSLWSDRAVATTNGVSALSSMALMGLTTFVPIYVQIVLHRSAVVAGLALTTMLAGWPAGSILAVRLFQRFGLHHLLLAGALLQPVGAVLIVWLSAQSSPVTAAMGSLIMGFGMGLMSISSLVLVQELVDPRLRGGATASILFSRNLGSTLGATVLGAVFNHALARTTAGASVTSDQLRQLIETQPGVVPADAALRVALQHSLNLTFWTMLAMTLATVLMAYLVPTVSLIHPVPVEDATTP